MSRALQFSCFKGPTAPQIRFYRITRTPLFPSFFEHFFGPLFGQSFFRLLAPKMPNLSPKGPQKPPKWSPKGSQKPNFLGIRAEVKIELPLKRELNFQGPGPPKTSPKRCQKPEQPSDSVPDLTFEPPSRPLARFGRVLVDLGTPWGGSANSLLEPFLIRILKFGPRGSK